MKPASPDTEWNYEARRLHVVRTFINTLLFLNFLFSIDAFIRFKSLSLYEKVLNTIYIICTVAMSLLLYQSYHGKLKQVYLALLLLTFRNLVPILNLDGNVDFYNKKNGHLLLTS